MKKGFNFVLMKGRGSHINPPNRFSKENIEYDDWWNEENDDTIAKTQVIEVEPKTILNKVVSRDLPFEYSANPYQGCEHGCAYCYARPTHQYWGYQAGLDFESKILVKKNAAQILEKELRKTGHKPLPIALSGNTDCYQPLERTYQLTRKMLEVCLAYRHPVSIITKNSLVLRDLDILTEMSKLQLVHVTVSITGTDEKLRLKLEPRTSTYKNRFRTLSVLSSNQIPCGVLIAPVIPALNDQFIPEILRLAADNGAQNAAYQIVRLNDEVQPVFLNWLDQHFPLRKEKILSMIKSCHGDQLSDKRPGIRMKGEGLVAESIKRMFEIFYQKYFSSSQKVEMNNSLFTGRRFDEYVQGKLF